MGIVDPVREILHGRSLGNRYYIARGGLLRYVAGQTPRMQGRLLDIGGGPGPFRSLIPPGVRLVSLEVSPAYRPDVVASAVRLPFAERSFDAILCTEVMEHIYETHAVLAEMFRVLRPGGVVILTTPFTWGLHYEPEDYWRFTPHAWARLLSEAGFNRVHDQRLGGLASALAARFADVHYDLADALLRRLPLGTRLRHLLLVILMVLHNLPARFLAPWLDKLDDKDMLSFGCVAERPGRGAPGA